MTKAIMLSTWCGITVPKGIGSHVIYQKTRRLSDSTVTQAVDRAMDFTGLVSSYGHRHPMQRLKVNESAGLETNII